MAKPLSANDPSSFSNPDQVVINHIHLNLNVDFSNKVLNGSAILNLAWITDNNEKLLFLDTRDLNILSVMDEDRKNTFEFCLGEKVGDFGQPLKINIPVSYSKKLVIDYSTSPNSTALQWLDPEQTCGKIKPYLFTQCQAIHARSLLPCQDTPAVKFTYSAEITTPQGLIALMSALRNDKINDKPEVFYYQQNIPIPSYLIALVVGDLHSRAIGPRSKVWSEKEVVEAAEYEFTGTEKLLATAEDLMGPYLWGQYDLLVLPPSFPYGGMENPCLTFVTPTLLAGDRSLISVVAHEIAHNWTGNLITNNNPEHFWLNEGHTVFVERKISGRLYGESFRHLQAINGWDTLIETVHQQFNPTHEFTKLVPDLTGVNPDDAFSSLPYEKGSALLMYLEEILGGPKVFEPFLKAYVQKFQFKSINTSDWKAFLYEFFALKQDILDQVDWNGWFNTPGMPPAKPTFDDSLLKSALNLSNKWVTSPEHQLDQFSSADLKDMKYLQVKCFLTNIFKELPLSHEKIHRMSKVYDMDSIKNSEIRFLWLRIGLRAKVKEFIERSLAMVNEVGRMKFVRPLYRDLYEWEEARSQAISNYERSKSSMHILTATMVGKDMKLIK